MPRPARAALVTGLLLASCSTAPASPTASGESHAGHEAGASGAPGTPHPSAPEGADGSIELESDFFDGENAVTVADGLEAASTQPVLVTGVLLRDADGGIWFCDAIDDGDPPACGRPRLWVTNFPDDEAVFAPENASNTGAETSGGVIWVADQQLFGIVHPAR